MKEGHIFIDGLITQDYHQEVKRQIAALGNPEKLVVHIQSPGGSVYAGYNTYHVLKSLGKTIDVIIEGEAQSMATFIALAGDTVSIKKPSVYMIHNPSQGLEGDADALQGGAEELRKIEEEMSQAYFERNQKAVKSNPSVTPLTVEEIKAMMKRETRMNAEECVRFGFADRIQEPLKAVATGRKMREDEKTILQKIEEKLDGLFKKAAPAAEGPQALDLQLADGRMANVMTEDGDLVGKPITVEGAVPEQPELELADGRVLVVADGVVTEIKEPVTPEQKMIADLQAKLQQAEAEKAAIAEKEKQIAAEAEKAKQQITQTAQALGDIKKEVETLKSKTVGKEGPPSKGMKPIIGPAAVDGKKSKEIEATMSFLNENFSWLKQYYPEGHFEKYASGPNMVSILETNFNYTYPGILTTELFYKPTLQAPALSDIFTIDQGIKDRKRYNLVAPLSKVLKPYTGCDRTFNGNRSFISNTTVQVKEFQVSESFCKDDFTNALAGQFNHLAQEWLKTGIESFDPSGTPISTVIDTILVDALKRDVFRRASFAAGNSSDDDYNQFDGLWDRLIDSSGASNYCVVRAGSQLGTGTLAAGAALTALEAVYANSNILLKDETFGKPTFWVTRSVWDNYYNSLIGTGAVTEQAFENLQKGLATLTYKGYAVKPVSLWDSFLAETDNPLTATTRHLILFTVKENHILGVEQGSDLNKIEGWYERKDRKFYYEADMKMGYNYLHCDLQTIAY